MKWVVRLCFVYIVWIVFSLLMDINRAYGQSTFIFDKPQILQIYPNEAVRLTDNTRVELRSVRWSDDHNAYAYTVTFRYPYRTPYHTYIEYWPQGELPEWHDIVMRAIESVYGE